MNGLSAQENALLIIVLIIFVIIIIFSMFIVAINKKTPSHKLKVIEPKKPKKVKKPKQEQYLPSMSLNPLKWGKYTLVINSAYKKFVDIYNFQTPQEFKQIEHIGLLAYTMIFEEARLNKLSPDEFEQLLYGLEGDSMFHKVIKPVGNSFFDFLAFKAMYSYYVNYRASEIRPIVAMMLTFEEKEGSKPDKESIQKYIEEYAKEPMFGREV